MGKQESARAKAEPGEAKIARELLRGSLDLMVLSVLVDGAKYGYLIQRTIREASDGAADIQAGTLYPLLHRLEGERLIRSRWDDSSGRRRKWYELTRAGKSALQTRARQWQSYATCVRRLLAPLQIDPA